MKKRMLFVLLGMFVINIFNANAQKDFQIAKKQFELGMYGEALTSIENLEKDALMNSEAFVLKGMCQYYLCNYYGAVGSFTKARALSSTDNSYSLIFAKALINSGQYDMAKAELSYLKEDSFVSHLMDYCDYANKHTGKSSKDIQLVKSKKSSFGSLMHNGVLMYNTYSMPFMDPTSEISIKGQFGFHLVNLMNQKEVNALKGLANRLNIGNISISKDNTVVYTKAQPLCESIHCRLRNSSIYIGKFENGAIVNEQSLPVNEMGVSNVDPWISSDGKKILFASNRMGGLGGFDIYSIEWVDGKWTNPINLGAQINTAGDEISPSYHDKTLIFSSNYHLGLGGYDIFQLVGGVVVPFDNVNSNGDDYNAKVFDNNIFYTSNRTGIDGIYSSQFNSGTTIMPTRTEIVDLNIIKDNNKSNAHEGARLVSLGYTITSSSNKSYFIQLGAFGSNSNSFDKFSKASKFGDVYKVMIGQSVKIRIGWFDSEDAAKLILNQVKKDGFPDAFVVGEVISPSQVELIFTSGKNLTTKIPQNTNTPKTTDKNLYNFDKLYKVRLASYEDPIWFDNSKVKDLGKIEQWSKGIWTIFVLGGFKSQEEAESARIKAVNRGFVNAEVVVDSGGILESIKKN